MLPGTSSLGSETQDCDAASGILSGPSLRAAAAARLPEAAEDVCSAPLSQAVSNLGLLGREQQ